MIGIVIGLMITSIGI